MNYECKGKGLSSSPATSYLFSVDKPESQPPYSIDEQEVISFRSRASRFHKADRILVNETYHSFPFQHFKTPIFLRAFHRFAKEARRTPVGASSPCYVRYGSQYGRHCREMQPDRARNPTKNSLFVPTRSPPFQYMVIVCSLADQSQKNRDPDGRGPGFMVEYGEFELAGNPCRNLPPRCFSQLRIRLHIRF